MIKRISFCVLSLVLLLLLPTQFAFAAPKEGDLPKVTAMKGIAKIQRAGGQYSSMMFKGMDVGSGDVITTDANSSVTVSYFRKEIVVGELTRVSMTSLWNRHGRDDSSVVLVEGMIKNRVDVDLNKNSRNEVRTSNTVAGVRGTEYIITYSRMGLVDGAEENLATHLKVIDGTVRLDLAAPDEAQKDGQPESFLVGIDGARKVTDDINGNQQIIVPKTAPKEFDVPIETLDSSILENLANDSRAKAQNPDYLKNIDSVLDTKKAAEEELQAPTKPEPSPIFTSEAAAIIPTLPVPTPTTDDIIPSAPSSSSMPESSSSTPAPSPSSTPAPSSSSTPAPSSSSTPTSSSSSTPTSPSSSVPPPPPVPDSMSIDSTTISGDIAASIQSQYNKGTTTITLTSSNSRTSLSKLTVPTGKVLIVSDITLQMTSVLRVDGRLVNQGAIDCNTLINRGIATNQVSGTITCSALVNSNNASVDNYGTIITSTLENRYSNMKNQGRITMSGGTNTGSIYNKGDIVSDSAIYTITNGTYSSVIYQQAGNLQVNDAYVICGINIATASGVISYDCGIINYSGGTIKKNRRVVDCEIPTHTHVLNYP